MRGLMTGVVLAAVLAVAGFLTPRLLEPADLRADARAAQQAELARRRLHHYDALLPVAAGHVDIAGLQEADPQALVQAAEAAFKQLADDYGKLVRQVQSNDRARNMTSKLRALAFDAGSLAEAYRNYEARLQGNAQLLEAAARDAREAGQTSNRVWLAAQMSGLARLLEATQAHVRAAHLRSQAETEIGRVQQLFTEWSAAKAELEFYKTIDYSNVQQTLTSDLEEIVKLAEEASSQRSALETAVATRKSELEQVRSELAQQRDAHLALEQQGFKLGDDGAFQAYRREYQKIATRLKDLQVLEQQLSDGGTANATFANDDLLGGAIQGDRVQGLAELERALALAVDGSERLARARASLSEQIAKAKAQAETISARLGALESATADLAARLDEQTQALVGKAEQAAEAEAQALAAGTEAVQKFVAAKNALMAWKNAAAKTQQEQDPERKNERLKRIAGDAFVEPLGSGSEAQARDLVGRFGAARLSGLESLRQTLTLIATALPDAPGRVENLDQQIADARQGAVEMLSNASGTYDRVAQRADADAKWAFQSARAGTSHLLSLIDSPNAAQHRTDALDAIRAALARNLESPYVTPSLVALYNLLTGEGGGAAQPTTTPAESSDESSDENG